MQKSLEIVMSFKRSLLHALFLLPPKYFVVFVLVSTFHLAFLKCLNDPYFFIFENEVPTGSYECVGLVDCDFYCVLIWLVPSLRNS